MFSVGSEVIRGCSLGWCSVELRVEVHFWNGRPRGEASWSAGACLFPHRWVVWVGSGEVRQISLPSGCAFLCFIILSGDLCTDNNIFQHVLVILTDAAICGVKLQACAHLRGELRCAAPVGTITWQGCTRGAGPGKRISKLPLQPFQRARGAETTKQNIFVRMNFGFEYTLSPRMKGAEDGRASPNAALGAPMENRARSVRFFCPSATQQRHTG
jgi:hypothetical protein